MLLEMDMENPVYEHVLVQEDVTDETVWWLADNLEEELELMSGTPCGVRQSSTIGTKDQTRVQEDLLRQWFQVEAELGIADAVKVEEGDSMASHMRTETSTESLLAEWYLFEKIVEAEEQLDNMAVQYEGMEAQTKTIIQDVVICAKRRIQEVVADAQTKVNELTSEYRKTIRSTSSLSMGEALMNKDVGTIVLDHGSALPTLLDSGLSFNISDSLSDRDSEIDYLTLCLEISFDDEDQDESAQYLISLEVSVHCDVLKPLGISHQSSTFHATESPGDMTDVNLLHGLNSDHCGIVSDTLINTECISSEESDRNSIPRWRWSGIRRDSAHRMPPHESSGKIQRGDVTWRRKRRNHSVLSELILWHVKGRHQKRELYPRQNTECRLKMQLMGPAMRKQRKPLSCWRYSRTTTHEDL